MTRIMKLAAMLAAFQPIAASAAPCVTAREAGALVRYSLPDVISGMSDKCRASLPSGAFLDTESKAMADRYRPAAQAAWPAAKPVIFKLAADQASFIDKLPDQALQPMVGQLLTTGLSGNIKPAQCPALDRIVRSLSLLPAENAAEMLVAMVELASAATPAGSAAVNAPKLSICPTPIAKVLPANNATITAATR